MNDLKTITQKLLDYSRRNQWAGFDPYDALNSRIFELLPFVNFRFPRLLLTQLLKRCPVNFRPLLLIPKTQNPKGIALFLIALIKLSKVGFPIQVDLIAKMVDMLIAQRSKGSSHWCWGYCFPWQTRTILVPRGYPNLVCTVFVANALLDVYELNHEKNCLDMAISAAEYIKNELYWTVDDITAGFSYPLPSSRTPVHNANFLAAALLCRVSKLTRKASFIREALTVAKYSASKQHHDGSWDYGEGSTQGWADNFHTGYNLCALQSIAENLGTKEFDSTIRRGYEFYRLNFFKDDGTPKYFHDRTYPIDIHSSAQSIITLLAFKHIDESSVDMAKRVLKWTIQHMWDDKGYFYYQILSIYKIKIPYIRWSQAWMLLALSTFIEFQDRLKSTQSGA